MRKNLLVIIVLLLSISSIVSTADIYAATTGKIAGRITDASGEPLPFVNIIVLGTNLGAAADIDGYYSTLNIPPGTYEIKASANGYNSTFLLLLKLGLLWIY